MMTFSLQDINNSITFRSVKKNRIAVIKTGTKISLDEDDKFPVKDLEAIIISSGVETAAAASNADKESVGRSVDWLGLQFTAASTATNLKGGFCGIIQRRGSKVNFGQ